MSEHELSCVVHVHSTFSDGTADVSEIVAAARAAGRDAVLLTDHDTMGARQEGLEGWHEDVLLVVGLEVSPRGGHLLAFGLDREIDHGGLSESEIAAAVSEAGAISFAAHPFSRGSRISTRIGRPHPWPTLETDELTGLELWSLITDAAESWRGPREAVEFMRDPVANAYGPAAEDLCTWDRLNQRRRVVGIGGLDAHQSGLRIFGRTLSPMPHERYFGLLGTYVLLARPPQGRAEIDIPALLDALRAGHCYLGFDGLAPAAGFRFWAEDDERRLQMGDEAPPGRWRLTVEAPAQADLRLLRDGTMIAQARGRTLEAIADAQGVYRVEAWRGDDGLDRLWLISNPIYLR